MKKLLYLFLVLPLIFSSCKKEGCTDTVATNYNSDAKEDDGSCTYVTAPNPYAPAPGECVWGCFDDATGGSNLDTEGGGGTYVATNYNPIANCYSACTY